MQNVMNGMNDLKVLENELVPVYETDTGEKVVYGSELHKVLEVRTLYKDWSTRRLSDVDAIENEDFEAAQICAPSGQTRKDHIIKLDTAKEMAMLERNEKGKQVRRYFIEVEKKYKEMRVEGQKVSESEKITDNQVRALELIVQCPSDRLPYVGMVLKASGFVASGKIAENPKKYSGQETVREFLQTTEIFKRPTADVYAEYCDYCEKYNINPIPHVVFSKCVNQISDSEIIYKRVSGKVKRCFI